jgi:hypothetical protein
MILRGWERTQAPTESRNKGWVLGLRFNNAVEYTITVESVMERTFVIRGTEIHGRCFAGGLSATLR